MVRPHPLPGNTLPTQLGQPGWPAGTPGSQMPTTSCHAVGAKDQWGTRGNTTEVLRGPRNARTNALTQSFTCDYGVPASEWAPGWPVQMERTARGLKVGCRGVSGGEPWAQWGQAGQGGSPRKAGSAGRVAGGLGGSGPSGRACALGPSPPEAVVSQSSERAQQGGVRRREPWWSPAGRA